MDEHNESGEKKRFDDEFYRLVRLEQNIYLWRPCTPRVRREMKFTVTDILDTGCQYVTCTRVRAASIANHNGILASS